MKFFLAVSLLFVFSFSAIAQSLTADRYSIDCSTKSGRSRVYFVFTDSELGVAMENLMFTIDKAVAKTQTYYFFGEDRIFLKYPDNKFAYLKTYVIDREMGLININFTDIFKQLKTKTPFTFVSEPNFDNVDGDVTLKDGSTFVGKVRNPYNPKGFSTKSLLLSMSCKLKLEQRIKINYPGLAGF